MKTFFIVIHANRDGGGSTAAGCIGRVYDDFINTTIMGANLVGFVKAPDAMVDQDVV